MAVDERFSLRHLCAIAKTAAGIVSFAQERMVNPREGGHPIQPREEEVVKPFTGPLPEWAVGLSPGPLSPSASGAPTCPICLSHVERPEDRAVAVHCMDQFCYSCITRWLDVKRQCPVCKRPLAGLLYDIQSDSSYQQRMFPREEVEPPARQRLEVAPFVPAQPHPVYRHPADVFDRYQGGRGRNRWERGHHRHRSPPPVEATERSRPYYDRVQRHLNSTRSNQSERAAAAAAPCPTAPPSWPRQGEPVLALRRAIYTRGLELVEPLPGSTGAAGRGGGRWNALALAPSGSRRFVVPERLSVFAERELRALLADDDVSFLLTFVVALLEAHGLEEQLPDESQRQLTQFLGG